MFPSRGTFTARWPTKDARRKALASWLVDKPEYSDVAVIINTSINCSPSVDLDMQTRNTNACLSSISLSDSYLPPIVCCVTEMSKGTDNMKSACLAIQANINIEFERRVAIGFQFLGLSVDRLGQGLGRMPVGIAKCYPGGWAIIYDAKVRSQEFRLLASEERKFREYIDQTGLQLKNQGIGKFYFVVVSSLLSERNVERANELCRCQCQKSSSLTIAIYGHTELDY